MSNNSEQEIPLMERQNMQNTEESRTRYGGMTPAVDVRAENEDDGPIPGTNPREWQK